MNERLNEKYDDQVTVRRRGTGLIRCDHERSAGGYTLFAPQTSDGNVYLIDIEGKIVHLWKTPVRPGRDAMILENGNLSYNGSHTTLRRDCIRLNPANC